jgi:hypothetical protein
MHRLPSSTVTSTRLDDLSGLSGTSPHLFLVGSARWLVGSLACWLIDSLARWLIGSLALLDRTSAAAFETVSLVDSGSQLFALFYYTIE